MNIDSIKNGIVIDHITAGNAMKIYDLLGLGSLDCAVAIIKNAASGKMGKKDIIKIDAEIHPDLDVIGYIDPTATVNIIRDGKLVEKKNIEAPKRLVNVIRCKNPRCITSVEPGLDQVFVRTEGEKPIYRCMYCDTPLKRDE